MFRATYEVRGMNCANCTDALKRAVAAVKGVASVNTSLEAPQLVVLKAPAVTDEQISEAVKEAGFELTGAVQA